MTDRSEIDIANRAMDLLGRAEIDDYEVPHEDLERAIVRNMSGALTETLRLSRWTRARKIERLPGVAIDDEDYAYEIQLPADCALVWRVGGREEGDAWIRVAGQGAGTVRANIKPPAAVEWGRALSPAELPEELAELAAACLAVRCSFKAALSAAQRGEVARAKRAAMRMAVLTGNTEVSRRDDCPSRWLAAMGG